MSAAAAAADVTAAAARTAAAVGYTRPGPGSASLYARLVSLILKPFEHVLDFVVCSLVPQLEIRHHLKTKNLHLICVQQRELLVTSATTTTDV